MEKLNKKGQVVNNLNTLIMGSIMFIVMIISIVIGIQVNQTLTTTNLEKSTLSLTNESNAFVIGTPKGLSNPYVTSITRIENGSIILNTGEYNLLNVGQANSQVNLTNASKISGDFNVSYSYYERSGAANVSLQGESGITTFSDYFGVIATVIILVVIVGLLIGVIALFVARRG